MKKYFIEIIARATENNHSFAGTVMRYVYGKAEEMVARQALNDPKGYGKYDREYDNTDTRWTLENYGFASKGMAERVIKQIHSEPDRYGYWEHEIRVIEVEI